MDQAGLGEEKTDALTSQLIELIKRDSNLLVYKSDQPMTSARKKRSPKYGIVTDPDLAKKAEELGMNSLVTSVLNPQEVVTERKGFWPFRRIKRHMEVSLLANAVDIMNGTLFLTNLEIQKIKLPKLQEGEEPAENPVSEEKLDKVLRKLLENQAAAIIDGLADQPWSGRVLSADGEKIIINAGKDVGLKDKTVFEVFGKGEPIKSVSGRSLFLLGAKVGEIQTLEVMDNYSSAVPITEGSFGPGQVIRFKD
jgi:hypothetical protein